MNRAAAALALLCGCAPGAVAWSTGHDALRTALWIRGESDAGRYAKVVLSTGVFDCELPEHDDPQEQWEALVALQAGACREDARHVVLTLYADHDWVADYPLVGSEGPQPDDDHVSEALYVGIDEATVVREEGLEPTWVPTEVTWYWGSGDPGDVRIKSDRNETLTGTFDLREAHVSGRFAARSCDGDASLLELLAASPTSACSTGAE